jgi:Carboxypeptidase regulatory-like domain
MKAKAAGCAWVLVWMLGAALAVQNLAVHNLAAQNLAAQNKKPNEDGTTRSVQGTVTDASGKTVADAVVQLKDTKALGIRSFRTDADGSYHFAGLSTNEEYELKADHDGATSGKKTLTVFNSKKTATINLKLNK